VKLGEKEMEKEKTFVLRIPEGMDVIEEMGRFCKDQNEKVLMVTAMQGRIKEYELLSAGRQSAPTKKFFREPGKVINVTGMVENGDDGTNVTLHISVVTQNGFASTGGRLVSAKAAGKMEIGLKSIDENKAIKMW